MSNLFNAGFFPLFAVLAFIAVVLLLEGLYLLWDSYKGPEAKKVGQRLRALSAGTDSAELVAVLKNRALSEVPMLERLLLEIPRIHGLDRLLLQSGLGWTVGRLLSISLVFAATVYVLLLFVHVMSLVLALVSLPPPFALVVRVEGVRKRAAKKIKQHSPDARAVLAGEVRATRAA